jgi:hypothetical protein
MHFIMFNTHLSMEIKNNRNRIFQHDNFFSDKIIGPLLWKYHLNNFPTKIKGINFVHEKYFRIFQLFILF